MEDRKINVWIGEPGAVLKTAYTVGVGLGVGALTVFVAFIMLLKLMKFVGLAA